MRITVNGKEVETLSPISYEDGVAEGLWREGETVTYQGPRLGDKQRAGILRPGKRADIEEGFRFNSAFTGSA